MSLSPQQAARVQRAVNAFNRKFKIPAARLAIDGRIGPTTKQAIRDAKYLLGYAEKYVRWASGTDDVFLKRLAHPTYRLNPVAIARGVKRRRDARKQTTSTVQGCARIILNSPNVTYWSGLSTGSERRKFVQLATTGVAYCDHTGTDHRVKLNLMQFLVDCAKAGPVMVNALTGGSHTAGSHHYADPCSAVDLDLSRGSTSRREALARKHGGQRNFESDHEHYDL